MTILVTSHGMRPLDSHVPGPCKRSRSTAITLACCLRRRSATNSERDGKELNMKVLVFRLTEADSLWYVWPCATPQLYSFQSATEAEVFARRLAESHPGSSAMRMEPAIEQAAAFV